MTRRGARRLAWSMWVVAVVMVVAAGLLAAAYPFTSSQETYDPIGEFIWTASWLGFGFIGALIVSQRPGNRIGWVLSGITVTLALGAFAPVYGRVAYLNPQVALPLGAAATWVGTWGITLSFGLVVALLLLYPSGELRSRRQRALLRALGFVTLVTVVVEALSPGPVEGQGPPENPLGLAAAQGPLEAASGVLGAVFAAVALLTLLDFVYRFWRSRGLQRQQFRWLALAAAAFPPLFVAAMAIEDVFLGPDRFDPAIPVVFICGNGIAVAIGVAITRHGLYEINRVISRSVSYLLLTAVLIGVYLGAVTILGTATAPFTEESPLAVAAATLLAAAVFGPARRRIQRAVDRRFNRARYDAAQTLDEFRSRLRDELDLESITDSVQTAMQRTVQPTRSLVWLRTEARS